ncbi:MAG: TolC family protein [Armatimonadota bacterium]
MRTAVLLGTLVALAGATAASGAAGPAGVGLAGLSPAMWGRVRAAAPTTVDLAPTQSPQAPEKLGLRECIALAFRYNSGFRQDQAQLVRAQRGLWVAEQRLFGTASSQVQRARNPGEDAETSVSGEIGADYQSLGGGSLGVTVSSGEQNDVSTLLSQRPSLSVSLDQPLVRGAGAASSTFERIRGARTALAAQQLSFYDARQDLAQTVIEAYCEVLLARGEVEIAQRSVDRAKQLYDINYGKFWGEGLKQPGEEWVSQVPEIDVDQARLSWERSKQDLISRQQGYRDAVDALLLAMGFLPGATPELTTTIVYAPQEYDEAALVQAALESSTQLGRLELSRQDALAARRIARSQARPDVAATLGIEDLGETLGGVTLSTGWFGGVSAQWPLYNRSLREEVADSERQLSVLEQRIVAARDSVKQEIQRGVRAATSSRARIDIGEQSVKLAQKSREAAQGMYDEGLSDYLRVLDAEDRLVQAERSLLQEQVSYFLTTVRIRRSLGEDITQGLPE